LSNQLHYHLVGHYSSVCCHSSSCGATLFHCPVDHMAAARTVSASFIIA
jgi:hypothetical protein